MINTLEAFGYRLFELNVSLDLSFRGVAYCFSIIAVGKYAKPSKNTIFQIDMQFS